MTYLNMNSVIKQEQDMRFEDCLDECKCGSRPVVMYTLPQKTLGLECNGCGLMMDGYVNETDLMVAWNKHQRDIQ